MTDKSVKKRKLSLNQFKNTSSEDQEEVLKRRKAENTNKSTKLWVDCLQDYLKDKDLGLVNSITEAELPSILEKFYVEVHSQKAMFRC